MTLGPVPNGVANPVLTRWLNDLHQQLLEAGIELGAGNPGVPSHLALTDVLKDQHHNQAHLFWGLDHTDVNEGDVPVSGDTPVFEGGVWTSQPRGLITSGISMNYRWDQDITATEPMSGHIKYNNADHLLVTEWYIHEETFPGNNAGFLIESLQNGDFLAISGNFGDFDAFTVLGSPVDNGTWYTIPVSYLVGDGGLGHQNAVLITILTNPNSRVPVGGTFPEVLQKLGPTDFDDGWAPMVRWPLAEWLPGQYYHMDLVRDGEWLMVANKDTTDRPAPQASGPEVWITDATPPTWPNSSTLVASTLETGNEYTFQDGAFINGVRGWIPTNNPDLLYAMVITVGAQQTISPTFTFADIGATGWVETQFAPQIIAPGVVVRVGLRVTNTATSSTIVPNYNFVVTQNPVAPIAGEINHSRSLQTVMSMHKTDADTTDRSVFLAGMAVGDSIQQDALQTWVITGVNDQGTYIDFNVTPAVNGIPGLSAMTLIAYDTQPIDFVAENFYWTTNPFGSNVEGFYSIDGAAAVLDDTLYGTDILIQNALVSADWDLAARTGGGGSSSGGNEGGGHVIQDEGISLTPRASLNFLGSAVTAVDNPGNDATDVTVLGSLNADEHPEYNLTSIASALTGPGDFGVNNALPANVTELYVSTFMQIPGQTSTISNAAWLLKIQAGDVLTLWLREADPIEVITFSATGPAVLDGGGYRIPVTHEISSANFIVSQLWGFTRESTSRLVLPASQQIGANAGPLADGGIIFSDIVIAAQPFAYRVRLNAHLLYDSPGQAWVGLQFRREFDAGGKGGLTIVRHVPGAANLDSAILAPETLDVAAGVQLTVDAILNSSQSGITPLVSGNFSLMRVVPVAIL